MKRLTKKANEEELALYNDFINKVEHAYNDLEAASKDWAQLENSENGYVDNLAHELPFHVPFQEIVDKLGIYAMKLKSKR